MLSVLIRAVDHDEGQYVAAIALERTGLEYRDFAYLQTPLQPLLLGPLSYLPAGWLFVAARAVNGLFGLVTLLLLFLGPRSRASEGATLIALAALLCTDSFLLASSLARNDALAMALLASAIPLLLAAIDTKSASMSSLAGLVLGLAASTKISFALPAAGAALFIIFRGRRFGFLVVSNFVAGVLAGLLPCLILGAIAPAEFGFDVLHYNIEGPRQWWSSLGQGGEFYPMSRLLKLTAQAALGSVIVALVGAILDRRKTDDRSVLNYMIFGGLIAAYLPVPALPQYLVPLLPPLFARFAFALDAVPPVPKKGLVVFAAVGSVAGLISSFVVHFSRMQMTDGLEIGQEVAGLARGGQVVTLSAEYIAGDGLSLDRRFASGPFLYRTQGALAQLAETQGRAVSVDFLQRDLNAHPPAVILVGQERGPSGKHFPSGLDQTLIKWASQSRYRKVRLQHDFVAFVQSAS